MSDKRGEQQASTFDELHQKFLSNVVAWVFGFERATYFELSSDTERVGPRVSVGV